jgi:hypothetical protein
MKSSDLRNKIYNEIKNLSENMQPKAKTTKVIFDKSTKPFEVKFSERGFEIGGERFSFEFIEDALSKNVHLILDNGNGMVLDRIKMDKILKYKNLYE